LDGYENLTIERILVECGLCDAHGFLVTAKKAATDGSVDARNRISKSSLIEFSFALAIPESKVESTQLITRAGEGQMLMKMPSRSGEYAFCIRYKSAGIGVDTDRWDVWLSDSEERLQRHQAILFALRDQILSPMGALTAAMLPHLTGLVGVIVVRSRVGRAPMYSPLEADFMEKLAALADDTCWVLTFKNIVEFNDIMNQLITTTSPHLPGSNSPT
jgi:CRISPR/Cas system-associated protein Cas7 (RAMP superfamily)